MPVPVQNPLLQTILSSSHVDLQPNGATTNSSRIHFAIQPFRYSGNNNGTYIREPQASISNCNTAHNKILKLSVCLSKYHSTKILGGIKERMLEFITSAMDKTEWSITLFSPPAGKRQKPPNCKKLGGNQTQSWRRGQNTFSHTGNGTPDPSVIRPVGLKRTTKNLGQTNHLCAKI